MVWKGWESDLTQSLPLPLNLMLDPSLGDPGRQKVGAIVGSDEVSFPPHCRHTLLPTPDRDPRQVEPPIDRPSSPCRLQYRGRRCNSTIFHPKATEAQVNTAASVAITSNVYYLSPLDRGQFPRAGFNGPPLERSPHAYPPLHD